MKTFGTFSLLAASSDSKLMGVAVASGFIGVGERVPHAEAGVGVIVTQANTNIIYGTKGLELLKKGLAPKEALHILLMRDINKDTRQVAMMDFKKRKAVFTGALVPHYHAEIIGEDYIVIGNLLVGKEVGVNIAKQFKNSDGDLAYRMLRALKAGSESGGDKRGEKSAALIMLDSEKVKVCVRVNHHENPIDELIRKLKQ